MVRVAVLMLINTPQNSDIVIRLVLDVRLVLFVEGLLRLSELFDPIQYSAGSINLA